MLIFRIQKYKTKDSIAMILLFSYLAVYFLKHFISVSNYLLNGLMAFLGNVSLFYVLVVRKKKLFYKYALMAAFLSINLLITIVAMSNNDLSEILWETCFVGIALLITVFEINPRVVGVSFWGSSLFLFYHMIRGSDVKDLFVHGSYNGLSEMIIFFVLLYYFLLCMKQKSVNGFPALVTFIVCLYGIGRSGIIVSGLLLMFFICFKPKGNIFRLRGPFIIVSGFLTGIVGIAYIIRSTDLLEYFISHGMKSPRLAIWKEYLTAIGSNISAFLFGPKIANMDLLLQYSGNTHNSFLLLHEKFGLCGFVFMFTIMGYSVYKLCKHKLWFPLVLFLLAAMRSFVDWTSFAGTYDVFWYLLIITGTSDILIRGDDNEKIQYGRNGKRIAQYKQNHL